MYAGEAVGPIKLDLALHFRSLATIDQWLAPNPRIFRGNFLEEFMAKRAIRKKEAGLRIKLERFVLDARERVRIMVATEPSKGRRFTPTGAMQFGFSVAVGLKWKEGQYVIRIV